MASVSDVMAGGAFIKITLDNASLNKGLAESQSRLKRFVGAINNWGTAVGLNAAMIQAPFVKALNLFSDFDLKMRQVKAITGETGKAFDELSAQARQLGRDTSFTTQQVASAMVMLGRMGFASKEIKEAIRPVMNLAKATGAELSDAAMVAGNNMRVFGLEADKLGDIADVVTVAVNKSAQSLQDFMEASAKAGPNFVNTGSDIREMAASLGVLANMGIRGSIAGTAVSRSIKRLADPRVIDFLKRYGIEVVDVSGNMRPLHENLRQIARVMSSLSHAERIHIAEEIFEVRGSLAGLPLAVNVDAIDEFLAKLRSAGGVSAKVAKEMDAGIYGTLQRLYSAFNDLSISVGQMFSISFTGLIKDITQFINRINDADSVFKDLFGIMFQIGTVLSVLGAGAKLFGMWASAITALFTPFKKLEDLIMGTTQKIEMQNKVEERNSLMTAASASKKIAAEKAKAAAIANTALKEQESALKQAKAAETLKAQEVTKQKGIAANAQTKIANVNKEYTHNYSDMEKSVATKQAEYKILQNTNSELKKKVTWEGQSLDRANERVKRLSREEAAAARAATAASNKLQSAQGANTASNAAAFSTLQKQQEAERLGLLKQQTEENARLQAQRVVAIQNDLRLNEAAIKKKEQLVKSYNDKIKAGVPSYKGLATIEQNRLAVLREQNLVLQQQLGEQKLVSSQAAIQAKEASKNAAIAKKDYAKSAKTSKVVVADEKALAIEKQNAEAKLQTLTAEKALAETELRDAQARHANATQELNDNSLLMKSKYNLLSAESERLYAGQKHRADVIATQESIKASAMEANVALQAEAKTLHGVTMEAEKNYIQAKRVADQAAAEAQRAQASAASSMQAVNAITANMTSAQKRKFNVNLAKEDYGKALREREWREKQLQKAMAAKQSAMTDYNITGNTKKLSQAGLRQVEEQYRYMQSTTALAAAQQKLNRAQQALLEPSRRYASTLVKAGNGSLFAAAASSKHAKQVLKTSLADVAAAARTAGASKLKTAGYVAEAAAAKGVAVATLAMRKALNAIVAHPVIATLVTLASVYVILKKVMEHSAKKAEEQTKHHQIAAENAKQEVEELRKLAQEEQEQIKYLVELEKKGSVTNEEQRTAQSIIDLLSKKYKNFNIVIDKTTGLLHGAIFAQAKLNELQREAIRQKTEEQIQETAKSIESGIVGGIKIASKESGVLATYFTKDSVSDDWAEVLKAMGYELKAKIIREGAENPVKFYWELPDFKDIDKMNVKQLKELEKKIKAGIDLGTEKALDVSFFENIKTKVEELIKARESLDQIKEYNFTGEKSKMDLSSVQAPSESDLENARKRLAEIDEKNSEKRLDNLSKETAAIEKQKKEYMEYVDMLIRAANIKEMQSIYNYRFTQSQIENKRGEIKKLKADNENGKNDNSISELTSDIIRLQATFKNYAMEIMEARNERAKYIGVKTNAQTEYNRQTQLARSEEYKRQMREMQNNSKLTGNWVDFWGKRHRGTLYENYKKQAQSSAEENRINELTNNKNFVAAMNLLAELIRKNSSYLSDATEKYNRLIQFAQKNGYYSGTMSQEDKNTVSNELSRLSSVLNEMSSRDFQLRQKLDEVKKASVNVKNTGSSVGAFSARELSRAIGGDSMEVKIFRSNANQEEKLGVISSNLNLALAQIRALNRRLGIA